MSLILRSVLTAALALICCPIFAQQIQQPKSLLPWADPIVKSAKPLPILERIPKIEQQQPAWLIGAAPRSMRSVATNPKTPETKKESHPLVDGKQYVKLGEIPQRGGATELNQRRYAQRRSPVESNSRQSAPFHFFNTLR